jgi:virginiamycin B lyase
LVPATNTITEWSIPTNASLPVSVSVDSSTDNVYFVESNSNKIGRLVPATNTITEWSIQTDTNNMKELTLGFSANEVYFVESNSNKIGRLVPATNTITEWSIQEKPAVINVDSAGSIHFIDKNGTRIYRLG